MLLDIGRPTCYCHCPSYSYCAPPGDARSGLGWGQWQQQVGFHSWARPSKEKEPTCSCHCYRPWLNPAPHTAWPGVALEHAEGGRDGMLRGIEFLPALGLEKVTSSHSFSVVWKGGTHKTVYILWILFCAIGRTWGFGGALVLSSLFVPHCNFELLVFCTNAFEVYYRAVKRDLWLVVFGKSAWISL